MKRLKLTVQYHGSSYHGWQEQLWERSDGTQPPTIEAALQHAWFELTGQDQNEAQKTFHVAGRTDAGVHAWGQVCHLETDWATAHSERGSLVAMDGLNRFLPNDIRVVRAAVVTDAFHARFSAQQRSYSYLLFNRRSLRPDLLQRAGHMNIPLNFFTMWQAIQTLPLGKNDFSGFRDANCQSKHPVCNLVWRELVDVGEGLYRFNISADRFLHHMVRNIIGTLIEIGAGKRPVDDLTRVLASQDRSQAGKTFSPDGLYLTRVQYPVHEEQHVVGVA